MKPFCEDGREFIRQAFNRAWDDPLAPVPLRKLSRSEQKEIRAGQRPAPVPGPRRNRIGHFVMNLPDTAILFLDAFRGVLSRANTGGRDLSGRYDENSMPMVHTHCFTRELEPEKAEVDIRQVSSVQVPRCRSGRTNRAWVFSGWKRSSGMPWAKTPRTTGFARSPRRRKCTV